MTETMKIVLVITLWPLEIAVGLVAGVWLAILWTKGCCLLIEWRMELKNRKREMLRRSA